MIGVVGLMVGTYTIIRMLEILVFRREPEGAWTFMQAMCILGILATLFFMFTLVTAGTPSAP